MFKLIIRKCKCGRVFEPSGEFNVVCNYCWHQAMQAAPEEGEDAS